MRGYFSRFPNGENREKAMMLTTTFRFSIASIFDPDYDPNGDPRLEILYALTESLDGVLFTPSSLRDARGRILLSADGEEEDRKGCWPKVLAEVSIPASPGGDNPSTPETANSTEEDIDAPSALRVARRARALTALTVRAILEQTPKDADSKKTCRLIEPRIRDLGIGSELEPDEWAVIQRPLGRMDESQQIFATWRLEGLVVLAWSLNLFEIPAHDLLADFNAMWNRIVLLLPCG